MKFKLALAQIDSRLGDLQGNIAKHLALAEKARTLGADLVVFPELSLTGYSIKDMNWDLAVNLERSTAPLKAMLEMSRHISILAGGVEESSSFHLYNSAFLFENGAVSTVHRKTYPPTYGMFEELRHFSKGDAVRAVSSKHGTLGVVVCEDLWHISLPYLLALQGAQIIIALVASPTRMGGNEKEFAAAATNAENQRVYARLLSSYLAFCNRVGYEDGVNFWGGSHIVGPDGEELVKAKLFDEDLVIADIDDHAVRRARRFSRHFLDEDPALVMRELDRIQRTKRS
jgi:predicted amidohydrolase